MDRRVVINDVGPRDGLQNQPRVLTPEQRLQIVEALLQAGVRHVQAGAFVSPRAVPAMAGTDRVIHGLGRHDAEISVLVPNMKGYELALEAGVRHVEMVVYATDGMARANAGMNAGEAEQVAAQIAARAEHEGASVAATIAVAFECPFDGTVAPQSVESLATRLLDFGIRRVVIADTIGAADPARVRALLDRLVRRVPAASLACHFHDTRAMGLANVFAALESGIRRFDASIAGVGGCPFAPGASGNVATEDVVMMVEQMGYETGINMEALLRASALVRKLTGSERGGRATAWLEGQLAKSA